VKRCGSESLSLEEKLVGGVPNGGAALVRWWRARSSRWRQEIEREARP
jgi:hypothetical protein